MSLAGATQCFQEIFKKYMKILTARTAPFHNTIKEKLFFP